MIQLKDLIVYNEAMDLGDEVWDLVKEWDYFEKQTVGRQLVRSSDSVAATIAEGHGRYQFGDRRQFAIYARGSLYETGTWIQKSVTRRLILPQRGQELQHRGDRLGRILNGYIRSIRRP